MFKNCESLKKEPPVSDWDTDNLIDDFGMFEGCNFAGN
jgi:surface protein